MHSTSWPLRALRCLPARLLGSATAIGMTLCMTMAGSAYGQSATAILTLDRATARALATNRQLVAAGFEIDAAAARREALALQPQLSVAGEIEDFAGSGEAAGIDRAESTLSVERVIELGGKRSLRSDLGDAAVARADLDRDRKALEIAAETARRFVDVALLQEELALARSAVDLAGATSDTVGRLVVAGRTSEAEQLLIDIDVARAAMDVERIGMALEAARVRLSALWGSETPDYSAVAGTPYVLPQTESFATLRGRVIQSPTLRSLESEADVSNAEARLAESARRPDLTATAGLRHLGPTDDIGLVVAVSVPIGSRSRAGAGIAAARARSAGLDAIAQQQRHELTAELYAHYQTQTSARAEFLLLQDDVLPAAEQAAALYRSGFELGSYSLFELTQAQNRLIELRGDALTAAGRFHRERVEIDYLLGTTTTVSQR